MSDLIDATVLTIELVAAAVERARQPLLARLAETCDDHELCADCDWHGSATPLCDSCAEAGVPIDRPITCAADPLHRHCPSCRDECEACQRVATAEDAADITTDGRKGM